MTGKTTLVTGIAEIADLYDGFIIDLWGVLHDGVVACPGVPDCLRQLKALGKQLCLLSNAPRRISGTKAKLDGMGLTTDLYDRLITSGESAFLAMTSPPDDWHRQLGKRLFHIGPPRDNDIYESISGLQRVGRPQDADFVVNTGIDDFSETLADYEAVLQACAEAKLPMICANPDLVVWVGDQLVICAGELARRYEELGGAVAYHGKPYPPVYGHCFDLFGNIPRHRLCAIGDSLRTDIAGAVAVGIDGLLITGGIHRDGVESPPGIIDADKLDRLVRKGPVRPRWAAPSFVW